MTAETNMIAKAVDGIIIVVKYDSTPKEAVSDLVDSLGKDKILGTVLNGYDLRTSGRYGYSSYGKYEKYYQFK